jgi:hypothetical protein
MGTSSNRRPATSSRSCQIAARDRQRRVSTELGFSQAQPLHPHGRINAPHGPTHDRAKVSFFKEPGGNRQWPPVGVWWALELVAVKAVDRYPTPLPADRDELVLMLGQCPLPA